MLHSTISPDQSTHADPDAVLRAAERAIATAALPDPQAVFEAECARVEAAYEPIAWTVARHEQEMADLERFADAARSPSLARLIRAAAVKKAEAYALERPHNILQYVERDLKRDGAEVVAIADAAEHAADLAWQAARDEAEKAGMAAAQAPFACLEDIVLRADAYARVVGTDENGDVHCDEDAEIMHRSLRAAIEEMIARQPDRAAWDAAADEYRRANDRLHDLCRQEEDREEGRRRLEQHVSDQLDEDLRSAYARKDELGNSLLAMVPPDAGGLLVQMDVIFDYSELVDVSRYERPTTVLEEKERQVDGKPVLTVEDLQAPNPLGTFDPQMKGGALLARNAAALRDRDMPRDWQELFETVGWMHINARDTAFNAMRAGADAAAFSGIYFGQKGAPDDHVPQMSFQKLGGNLIFSTPKGCWETGMVQ